MADQFKVDETVDFESEFGESGTAFPMPDALKSEKILDFNGLDLDNIQPLYKATDTEPTTVQGTSLRPVEDSDIFSLVDAITPDASTIFGVMTTPGLYSFGVDEDKLTNYSEGVSTVIRSMKQEQDRIENVLKDTLGEKYQGSTAQGLEGFDLFATRDELARKKYFEDMKKYFEDKYPGSRYFRVGVGGKKLEHVFQLVEDGPIYRVDSTGRFSDFVGDVGDVTGTLVNFANASSIAGSFLHSFFGTAGGYVIGDMIDRQLAQEGIDTSRDEFLEQFKTDAVLQGLVEGVINQFAPGMGKYFVAKFKGDETGVPFSMLMKKIPKEGLEAQKLAIKMRTTGIPELGIKPDPDFPLLGVGQLATKSLLAQRLFSQSAGISPIIGNLRNKQQAKILDLLEKKSRRDGGFQNFTQAELDNYILFKGNTYSTELMEFFNRSLLEKDKLVPGSDKIFNKIIEDSNNLKKSLDQSIDKKFLSASQKANSADATFDLSDVVKKANEILYGIRTRAKPKKDDKTAKSIGLNIPQGPLGDQLQRLVNIIDPNVSKLVTSDLGTRKTFSALKQITTIRNDLADIIRDGGAGAGQAKEIIELIDNAIMNPSVKNNVAGKEMLKFLDEGKELYKLRAGVINRGALKKFFKADGSFQPRKVVGKIFSGEVDDESMKVFFDFVKVASKNKKANLATMKTLREDIGNSLITYISHNPEKGGEVVRKFIKDEKMLNLIFPSKRAQRQLKDFAMNTQFIEGSVFKSLMKTKMENLEVARNFLNNATEAEIKDFVRDSGGYLSEKVVDLRHAILDKIFKDPSIKGTSPDAPDVEVINAKKFTDKMNNFINFSTDEFAKFKPLFTKPNGQLDREYLKRLNEVKNYTHFTQEALDTGGSIAVGSRVGSLINNLDLGAIATIMKSNLLARAMSIPPTVQQLEKAIGNPVKNKIFSLETLTAVTNAVARSYGYTDFMQPTTETLDKELERTGKVPEVSALETDTTSKVASITPNTLNLSLPKVSGGGNVNPPNNQQYASLFPFDTTGTAIANRAGIMGLT